MSLIKLVGVDKSYRTKEIETLALENVNLEVEEREFVSIMGPSGCGKSTLLNLIGLLDKPTKGEVLIDGRKVGELPDAAQAHFRNANIGFVFQSFHLIPTLNVADNVELPLLYRGGISDSERRKGYHKGSQPFTAHEAKPQRRGRAQQRKPRQEPSRKYVVCHEYRGGEASRRERKSPHTVTRLLKRPRG